MELGRQELAFGEQRLLGHLAWVNTGRSFDAARVILRAKGWQADVFGASLVRSLPDEFDKSGNGNLLAGVYVASAKVVPQAAVEPYVFWRRDKNLRSEQLTTGTLSQTTMGARVAGKLPARLDYGVEMVLQRGSIAEDSVNADTTSSACPINLTACSTAKIYILEPFAKRGEMDHSGSTCDARHAHSRGAVASAKPGTARA